MEAHFKQRRNSVSGGRRYSLPLVMSPQSQVNKKIKSLFQRRSSALESVHSRENKASAITMNLLTCNQKNIAYPFMKKTPSIYTMKIENNIKKFALQQVKVSYPIDPNIADQLLGNQIKPACSASKISNIRINKNKILLTERGRHNAMPLPNKILALPYKAQY